MKRKIVPMLFAVVMAVACAFGFAACFEDEGGSGNGQSGTEQLPATEGPEYELINDNTEYEVVGLDAGIVTDMVIPSTYQGLPVTSIGADAFEECTGLTSVTFENASGWWCALNTFTKDRISLPGSDLSDPAKAAECLTSTYNNYYWKRT